MSGIRLSTCALYGQADQPWTLEQNAELDYFCAAAPGEGQAGGAQAPIADWRKGGRIIQWLQERRPRVVVLGGYADLCRARVLWWCHRRSIPVFLSTDSNVRAPRPTGLKGLIKKHYLRAVFARTAGILVCGRNGADYFSSYGYPTSRLFVSPVEPNYRVIEELNQTGIDAVLQARGVDPARKRIVACARLIPLKRHDLAIDAFAAIAAERPEWDLLLIGNGPLLESLRGRVPPALKHRVIFAGFIGDAREIGALYRASHVLLLTSEYEGFGLVIPEAAAAGMALVCSSIVGAAPELVAEGVNGRCFPTRNLRLLTVALRDATDESRNERYRRASPEILADWRRRADPVAGLAQALASVGVQAVPPTMPER